MSLHNNWGDFNKVVQNERVVKFASDPTIFDGDGDLPPKTLYWTITRTSSMSYKYIALSREGANDCVEDLRRKYTRPYLRWTARVIENDDGYPDISIIPLRVVECSTEITPSLVAGDDWEVSVSVNETDSIIVTEELKTIEEFEGAFQEASAREDADAGITGTLTITGANWESYNDVIWVQYQQTISGFNANNISVEVWNSVHSRWDAATGVTATNTQVSFDATGNKKFRLTYNSGSVVSKEWTTHDAPRWEVELDGGNVEISRGATYLVQTELGSLTVKFNVHSFGPMPNSTFDSGKWIGSVDFGEGQKPLSVASVQPKGTDAQGRNVCMITTKPYPFNNTTLPKTVSVYALPIYDQYDLDAPYVFTMSNYVNVLGVTAGSYDKANARTTITFRGKTDLSADDIASGLAVKYDIVDQRTGSITGSGTATLLQTTRLVNGEFSAQFYFPISTDRTELRIFVWAEVTPLAEIPVVPSLGKWVTVDSRWLEIASVVRGSTNSRVVVGYNSNMYPKSAQNGTLKVLDVSEGTAWENCSFVSHSADRSDVWSCPFSVVGKRVRFALYLDNVASNIFEVTL